MDKVRVGTLGELQAQGCLVTKVGSSPVVVFWSDGEPLAVEDRCPHLGFPLHRGTVECGMVTCHWHHARFDLASGGTLDPWADDAVAFPVTVDDGDVWVGPARRDRSEATMLARLRRGLEDDLGLVIAKSVLALDDAGVDHRRIVGEAVAFGVANRREGFGAGLTVLGAMARLLPHLRPQDRPRALVHALSFLSGEVAGRPPFFPLEPLGGGAPAERLADWYRRFVETRSRDGAERSLASLAATASLSVVEDAMFAAVTDHVLIDEGHALDFTNKAFELLEIVGDTAAPGLLASLVTMTVGAERSEELSAWRHPHDLAALISDAGSHLRARWAAAEGRRGSLDDADVARVAHGVLADEPGAVVASIDHAIDAGATGEQLGRAVALAAALRITRFHTVNDHQDWNDVHHSFTTANALHQALSRRPTIELLRGVYHTALRIHLDRFLNIPAARLPTSGEGELGDLMACWDRQGQVDEAAGIVWGHLEAGGDPADVVAALGRTLLDEDAGFHWYQTVEAAVAHARSWPPGSIESRIPLVAAARFLAAHTPTRRELARLIDIARRLERGEPLHEAT